MILKKKSVILLSQVNDNIRSLIVGFLRIGMSLRQIDMLPGLKVLQLFVFIAGMVVPDSRFKDKGGFCKLCHKVCFDTEADAEKFIAESDLGLKKSYLCPLYPSGYWHVTRSNKKYKELPWKLRVIHLGPKRSKRIFDRIRSLLEQTRAD